MNHALRQARSTIARAILAALVTCANATAQEPAPAEPLKPHGTGRLVAAGDPVTAPGTLSGHAWVYTPARGSEAGALLHAVPAQGVQRASIGSIRQIIALQRAPLALAGWRGTAFLLLGPEGDDATAPVERQLSSITASGPIAPGSWSYNPAERLELRAPLPRDVTPRSFTVAAGTPLFIWTRTGQATQPLQIAILDQASNWRTLTPPPGWQAVAEAHALPDQAALLIATRFAGESSLSLWQTTLDRQAVNAADRQAPFETRWTRLATLPLPNEFHTTLIRTIGRSAQHWLVRQNQSTILAARSDNDLTIWRLDPEGPITLTTLADPAPYHALFATAGQPAVSVLSFQPRSSNPQIPRAGAPPPPEFDRLRFTLCATADGSILADLPAHSDGLFSRQDFQILWFLFIGVGVVILMVVLKSDTTQQITLPDDLALAGPPRRLLAGLIDIAIAVAITTVIVGTPPAHWLAASTSAGASLVPLATLMAVGWALSSLTEATLRASPGKLLTGIRVMSLVPIKAASQSSSPSTRPTAWTVARLSFAQALIRNAVRWFMPPLGMIMALDGTFRHPGDMLARSITVVRFIPDNEPPPPSDDDQ